MKMAFATCVQLGLGCIEEIFNIGGSLNLLITLNDNKGKNKSGRIYLDEIAKCKNIPLLKINNINDEEVVQALETHEIDWLFIIGWSQIAKKHILNAPKFGCIGMHPTLLPVGRGRAAIPWAIIKGLPETGVTMFKLDEGVDSGEIFGQQKIRLSNQTTATQLYAQANEAHSLLIRKHWHSLLNNSFKLQKQDESMATIWNGRTPADGEILSDMAMDEADKLVRATTHPYPGAFYFNGKNIVRVWQAKTCPNSGTFRLSDGFITPLVFENEEV